MELTLGDKLKAIHKDFKFDMTNDAYENKDFVIEWLEGDLFDVGTLIYDPDTGLTDCRRIGLMSESQLLFYLSAYYYDDSADYGDADI